MFRSLEDDAKASAAMENSVVRSPELSGITYVQGRRGTWGMPHMLRMIDGTNLDLMREVVTANESCLRAEAHQLEHHGGDSHVDVWVALTGPATLAGRLYRFVCRS